MNGPATVKLFGLSFFAGTRQELLSELEARFQRGDINIHITTVNAQFIEEMERNRLLPPRTSE